MAVAGMRPSTGKRAQVKNRHDHRGGRESKVRRIKVHTVSRMHRSRPQFSASWNPVLSTLRRNHELDPHEPKIETYESKKSRVKKEEDRVASLAQVLNNINSMTCNPTLPTRCTGSSTSDKSLGDELVGFEQVDAESHDSRKVNVSQAGALANRQQPQSSLSPQSRLNEVAGAVPPVSQAEADVQRCKDGEHVRTPRLEESARRDAGSPSPSRTYAACSTVQHKVR
eukprot:3720407-Pleurochrysis_carterae.AAC.2